MVVEKNEVCRERETVGGPDGISELGWGVLVVGSLWWFLVRALP